MSEQNLSAHDVARRSGNEVSAATITKILNGDVSSSGTKTLAAIAKGIGVSDIEIFRAANGDDVSRPLHFQIYAERFDAGELNEQEWQFLEAYFRTYVAAYKAGKAGRQRMIEKMVDQSVGIPPDAIDLDLTAKPGGSNKNMKRG